MCKKFKSELTLSDSVDYQCSLRFLPQRAALKTLKQCPLRPHSAHFFLEVFNAN